MSDIKNLTFFGCSNNTCYHPKKTLTHFILSFQQLTGDIHEEVESHNRMLDRVVCVLK